MERDPKTVPTETAKEPAPNPLMGCPCRCGEQRNQQVSPGSGESFRPDQTDEPAPEREVQSEVDRQQEGQAVKEKALIQNPEGAEPTERAGEKNDPGEISE